MCGYLFALCSKELCEVRLLVFVVFKRAVRSEVNCLRCIQKRRAKCGYLFALLFGKRRAKRGDLIPFVFEKKGLVKFR